MLTTPVKVSQSLLTKYQEAVGDLYCRKDDDDRLVPHDQPQSNSTFFTLPPINQGECERGRLQRAWQANRWNACVRATAVRQLCRCQRHP